VPQKATLEAGMWLVGAVYNFCRAHHSLRLPNNAGMVAGTHHWIERTPAQAAVLTDPLLVASLYDPAANNRGFDNRYWYLNPGVSFVRFAWERDFKKLRVFKRTPGEENGRYLTDADKDQVIAANNIPAQPE
jgi:hypothetical protein